MYTATNAATIRARESWRASREPATTLIRGASAARGSACRALLDVRRRKRCINCFKYNGLGDRQGPGGRKVAPDIRQPIGFFVRLYVGGD